ncbi:unnamed protein product [Parascedosporium putredinis]|uniref:Uncharacterized protein n=1 Tax=Parascedosporium putredinis TaxID=1442378 RepID=A0A9P1HBM7_9PEZI|nr:unnamed protein product [Parascedosporium putredinis]CAI8002403.1 unnamed protein product [Parascedosporium putredinis]
MREAEPSLSEKAFVLQAIEEKQRVDGRGLEDYRPLELTFGDDHGVAEVQLGKTRVLVKVSGEVSTPYTDRPFDGIFTIAAELSPSSRPQDDSAIRRAGRRVAVPHRRQEVLGAPGRRARALLDGNLVDAACVAVVAALRHFRKPDSSTEGESLLRRRGDKGVVVDATWLEEQVRSGSCTVGMNKHGEICQVSKLGGAPVEAVALLQCGNLALAKVKEFSDLLDAKLAEDAKRRDKGGLIAQLSAENDR